MKKSDLSRRDFSKLTVAAFGGMLAGTAAGCGGGADDAAQPEAGTPDASSANAEGEKETGGEEAATDVSLLLEEPHVCRGLNACEGKGAGGDNKCAGQGQCATAKHHGCHADNKCKGQGGCETTAGINSCSGKGACSVPLSDGTWKRVRAAFEKAMSENNKEFGDAPAAAES